MGAHVLSLFDGISCAQIAINKVGLTYDKYYSSEIDEDCIKVTQHNYPNTIQLGDVTKIKGSELPEITLLIGGSPCQGFSLAGKQLNFNDPRSKLFFDFVRILKECKPKYFLLENVAMKPEWEKVISEYLQVEQITINSSLLSAQHRKRMYWTNISNVVWPEDKKLFLKHIMEDFTDGNYDETKKFLIPNKYNITDKVRNKPRTWKDKKNFDPTKHFEPEKETLTYIKAHGNIRTPEQKSKTLTTGGHNVSNTGSTNIKINEDYIRILTPLECERLQTVPENYTCGFSDNIRYKMLGNSFTVDVIAHILSS